MKEDQEGEEEHQSGDDDDRQTDGNQQEIQNQPVIRSTTVLLKRSADVDQQRYKPEGLDSSLEPSERNAR